jgi:tetratricopeptide (TPR) repeat protein
MAEDVPAVTGPAEFPPPDPDIAETVERVLHQAFEHFARKNGNERIAKKDDFWVILKLSVSDLSHWKAGTYRAKDQKRPIRTTKRLLEIFSGSLPHDPPRGDSEATYARIVNYLKLEHASPLLRVVLSLDVYYTRILDLHERKRGSVKHAVRTEESEWGLLPPGPQEMCEFENRGEAANALNWLKRHWPQVRSWDTFAHILRLTEASGIGMVQLPDLMRMREQILGNPDEDLESAIRYYHARILGQANLFAEAIDLHSRNDSGRLKLFPLKSQFELAQLKFRVEDFSTSREAFWILEERFRRYAALMNRAPLQLRRLRVDTWKFLGTYEKLHLVFDPPQAAVVLGDVPQGNAQRCLQIGMQAVELAEAVDYMDGAGWGHVVQAFAYEGQGRTDESAKSYEAALACHSNPKSHGSSWPYTAFYRVGMLRRSGRLSEATAALEGLDRMIRASSRPPYRAELHAQQALLTELREGKEASLVHHRAAIAVLWEKEGIRASDWGVTRRLLAWCRQCGWRPDVYTDRGTSSP